MARRKSDEPTRPTESVEVVRDSGVGGRYVKTGATGGSMRVTSVSTTKRQRGRGGARFESDRLERLVEQLGNNRLAKLMDVSPSQPSRWRSAKEGIGPENQRRLIDLDYVFGRLAQLFTPRQAEIWLTSENAHLGARPIDVLRLRGAAPVIAAIDAEAQGAFA